MNKSRIRGDIFYEGLSSASALELFELVLLKKKRILLFFYPDLDFIRTQSNAEFSKY